MGCNNSKEDIKLPQMQDDDIVSTPPQPIVKSELSPAVTPGTEATENGAINRKSVEDNPILKEFPTDVFDVRQVCWLLIV